MRHPIVVKRFLVARMRRSIKIHVNELAKRGCASLADRAFIRLDLVVDLEFEWCAAKLSIRKPLI